METVVSPSFPFTNQRWPLRLPSSSALSIFSPQALLSPSHQFPSLRVKSFKTEQPLHLKARKERGWSALSSSPTDSPPSDSPERWLLEPAGDGDCRHIGFKVPLPDAFEIASNVVTVGRLPGKVDMVIPIATVSGIHARLEKKGGTLLVTDMDSTNGTYIDDQKLRPSAAATVSPGSCITFGDTHLAKFRVSKVEEAELASKTGEPDIININLETAS